MLVHDNKKFFILLIIGILIIMVSIGMLYQNSVVIVPVTDLPKSITSFQSELFLDEKNKPSGKSYACSPIILGGICIAGPFRHWARTY